jgi:hydroxyacylglutathione hydrolase
MVVEQILVTGMAVFCYLIADEDTKEAALVDPAGDFDLIFERVRAHGVSVRWVINTHWHFDHSSGNEYVIRETGAQLLIHEKDAGRLTGVMNRLLTKSVGGKTSPKPYRAMKDNDMVSIGRYNLAVVHTPGHTEGSICLYGEGNLFTGDTLFTEGYGRTDLADGSERKIIDSIRNRILTLPDDTVIWPGHHYGRFPTSTVREQKQYYQ